MGTSDFSQGGERSGEGVLSGSPHRVFGQYQILEALGRGAVGEVFRARGLSGRFQGRQVCLKLLGRRHLDDTAEHVERSRAIQTLRVEAEVLGQIEHPNIARVLEHGLLNDVWFVVFELVEGANLARVLRVCSAGRGLPENQVCAIGWQVAQALACAHERDVLHRDVKPSNIMIGKSGQVKLVDFGLAKVRAGEASYFSHVGTPPYWAPEQIRCLPLTAAADVYALGVVMAEAAIGHALFEAHGVDDFSESVIRDGREVDVAALPVAESLRETLAHCLATEPSARPTAAALAAQLAAALGRFPASQLGAMARRTRAAAKQRSPLKLSAFGVGPETVRPPRGQTLGSDISTPFSDRDRKATQPVSPRELADRALAAMDSDGSFHGSVLADLDDLVRLPGAEVEAHRVGHHKDTEGGSAMSTTPIERPNVSPDEAWSMGAAEGSDSVEASSVIADSLVEDGSTLPGRVAGRSVAQREQPDPPDSQDLRVDDQEGPITLPRPGLLRDRPRLRVRVAGVAAIGFFGVIAVAWSLREPPAVVATTAVGPSVGAVAASNGVRPSHGSSQASQSITLPLAAVQAALQVSEAKALSPRTMGSAAEEDESSTPSSAPASHPAPPPGDPPSRRSATPSSVRRVRAVETVTIGIIPEGEVWVDGKALGRAPVQAQLTRGRHRIVGRLGDQEIARTVRVTKKTKPIVLDLWHAE